MAEEQGSRLERGASAEAAVVAVDRFMPGGTISKLVGTRGAPSSCAGEERNVRISGPTQ